jgi:hypothetical protein
MKRSTLILVTSLTLAFSAPAFAQRGHGGGPPAGHGPGMNGAGASSSAHDSGVTSMSHSSPSAVLSHNTAIAGKINALTGMNATDACSGFKNLGQCVAAAHVAKNLDIPGGFTALKDKMTGTGSMSLGKAIQALSPNADSKAEAKKGQKQADQDMKEASETNS